MSTHQNFLASHIRELNLSVIRNDIGQLRSLLLQHEYDIQFPTDALLHAAQNGYLDCIQALLPFSQVTGTHHCSLMAAIVTDHREAACLMLDHYTNPHQAVDVLFQAVEREWDEVVMSLLNKCDTARLLKHMDGLIEDESEDYTYRKNKLLDYMALKAVENTPKSDTARKKM